MSAASSSVVQPKGKKVLAQEESDERHLVLPGPVRRRTVIEVEARLPPRWPDEEEEEKVWSKRKRGLYRHAKTFHSGRACAHMRPSAGMATSQMEQARPRQRPAAAAVEGRRSGVMGHAAGHAGEVSTRS